ncbi:MAG: tRNA epoxyqueuosine(34) reductase QueG [Alkalispirochaeta sp.]
MIVRTPWQPAVPEELAELFRAEGVSLLGVAAADPDRDRSAEYARWLAKGYHGTMEFLVRHQAAKFDPGEIVPGARSVIFAGLNYYRKGSMTAAGGGDPEPRGRIARYAWGRDYHKEFGSRLKRIARTLAERYPDERFRSFTDATPLSERHYAERSGIGFTGRNTLLINGKYGSWFFLGEIVSTLPFPPSEAPSGRHGACPRRCTRCIDVCPTGALIGPHRIDASRCISYLTIEHDGPIPVELRPRIGSRLFGCDLCQEVCPLNVRAQQTSVDRFLKPIAGETVLLRDLLSIRSHEAFTNAYGGSPLMRRGWKGMIGNAAVVAANVGARELIPLLQNCLEIDDSVIKEHVTWAITTLSSDSA